MHLPRDIQEISILGVTYFWERIMEIVIGFFPISKLHLQNDVMSHFSTGSHSATASKVYQKWFQNKGLEKLLSMLWICISTNIVCHKILSFDIFWNTRFPSIFLKICVNEWTFRRRSTHSWITWSKWVGAKFKNSKRDQIFCKKIKTISITISIIHFARNMLLGNYWYLSYISREDAFELSARGFPPKNIFSSINPP